MQLNNIYVRMQVNKFYLILHFSICFPGRCFPSYNLLHFLGESDKAFFAPLCAAVVALTERGRRCGLSLLQSYLHSEIGQLLKA